MMKSSSVFVALALIAFNLRVKCIGNATAKPTTSRKRILARAMATYDIVLFPASRTSLNEVVVSSWGVPVVVKFSPKRLLPQ